MKFHIIFLLMLTFFCFLRFGNIASVTTFGGDQGYDYLQIHKMVSESNITLLGPKIGPYNKIGNLYLGPFYYYILTPALILSGFDPVGPAILTALLSILSIALIYVIGLRLISAPGGLLASAFYGFSPILLRQSQSSSNPHLLPFFGALIILGMFMMLRGKSKNISWPIVVGLASGISFQLHYLAITIFLISLIFLLKRWRNFIIVGASFIAGVSPQIVFELKHSFFITSLFLRQISVGGNVSSFDKFFAQAGDGLWMMLAVFAGSNYVFIFGLFLLGLFAFVLKKYRTDWHFGVFNLMVVGSSVAAASLYSGKVSMHYLAVSYPSFVLLFSIVIVCAWKAVGNKFYKLIVAISVVQIFSANLLSLDLSSNQGYTMPQGWNLRGLRTASEIISTDVGSSGNFNVASVLDGDTRAMPLRYLVTIKNKRPQPVENYSDLDTLYLLTRDDNEAILNYTVWEVDTFNPFEVTSDWDIQNGIHLKKLEKLKNENP